MGKILYLECNSGISGDMTVGALLDLGADRQALCEALESLGVDGYHLHFGRTKKNGLDAFDFDVHLECGEGEEAALSCDHGCGHAHNHNHNEDSHHNHRHDHHHAHSEDCSGDHHHAHSHVHHHGHVHRNLSDIYEIIDRLNSNERVKSLARKMFRIVAEAESKAHGLPIDQVHFHEVGAIDSIVDIVSVALCLDNLKVDEVVVSPLAEGRGHVHCQHGIIPVPVPATANIAAAYGLELHLIDNQGEMVTPTGAAIAAALKTRDRLPKSCRILKTGLGAGKREYKQANVLRAFLLEETVGETVGETVTPDEAVENPIEGEPSGEAADMWVLETNIDDSTGEMLGFAMELLLEAGAADVWSTPIFMKKNRPACLLSVLCKKEQIAGMEEIIFIQTTSIGIRRYPIWRTALERRRQTVETGLGPAEVKICSYKGKDFCYPEYESVKSLCRDRGLDYQSVYHQVRKAAEEK